MLGLYLVMEKFNSLAQRAHNLKGQMKGEREEHIIQANNRILRMVEMDAA